MKKQVLDVMRATGLLDLVGAKGFYATAERALEGIYSREAENSDTEDGLRPVSLPRLMAEQRLG
jgi:hypothetical protein